MPDLKNKGVHLDPFNGTFGMPPQSHVSDSAIINSMPVLQIMPGVPNFQSGLTLFRVDTKTGWSKYLDILAMHGYTISTPSINLAFIADNFPTDSFTNEYGETFLQKFTDVASQGMQQMAQLTNAGSGTEAVGNLGGAIKNIVGGNEKTGQEAMEGPIGSALGAFGSGLQKTATGLQNLQSRIGQQSSFLGGALNSVDKMLAGHRVDFPMIWRNSGFTPSYTATVRLYNPKPGSKRATKQHIIGPIAAILCLAIPQSDDGKTFQWPFFLKVRSAGIYRLDPAVITNVTIVKGGDQQQIAFNQALGMVDVRIDFSSLYGSMVVETETNFEADRPTLRNYLAAMEDTDRALVYTRKEMRENARSMSGATDGGPSVKITATPNVTDPALPNFVENALASTAAARNKQAPTVTEEAVTDRVNKVITDTQGSLINAAQGSGFYPSSIA